MRTLALATALTVAPLAASNAQETYYADVNGVTVNVHVPEGYCALTGETEDESMLMDYISQANAGVNDVLISFADCGQLQDWRQNARAAIDNYGFIATPVAANLTQFPGDQDDLNAGLDPVLSNQFGKIMDQAIAQGSGRAQSILDELESGVRIEETAPLGYFGYDSYGIYAGMMQKFSSDQGMQLTVIGIYSTIAVQNRLLYFYLWDTYRGDANQVDELLELTQLYSRNQHEVN
jgi:hypothetical protein